ncbi:sulfurtransferase [Corynebacterium phocae]|uniref:Sulfurtransferase n=1 Tax=Corynebacterium phocae TaxID=161895 RepID=A0A1L7D567_9CORY|nr:rhodanese-like domain-containing protein [Corynebacterium phocae]APT93288.1 sulfurtransferase [Corynebacterium phocae]KAA8721617.1 rhodanese-like domain-containing protein [Corynebacterium phocae]
MKQVEPKNIPSGAQIIDVREDWEYATDHAKGVKHIPMGELAQRVGEIDPDQDIYVICKSGGRSAKVCAYLEQSLGWDAHNVAGGTDRWREEGLPME